MACQRCRAHHYRCDGKLPVCGRCQRKRQDCVVAARNQIRQPQNRPQFKSEQVWLPLPSKVGFVDETSQIQHEFSKDGGQSSGAAKQSLSASREITTRNDSAAGETSSKAPTPTSAVETRPTDPEESPEQSQGPLFISRVAAVVAEASANSNVTLSPDRRNVVSSNADIAFDPDVDPSISGQGRYLDSYHLTPANDIVTSFEFHPTLDVPRNFVSLWPIENPLEARLLRHFIDNVSSFFDFCDPQRHFAIEVPQRARNNRTLASAIFALSARHLSRTTKFDSFVADRYHQECLQTLIPILGETTTRIDDALLAALVALRLLEEMDGSDLQRHLIGTQAIIRAQKFSAGERSPSLWQAACWAAFRQELYICLTCERTVQLDIKQALFDWSDDIMNDWDWASSAVIHCRDVVQFAFGGYDKSLPSHSKLLEDNLKWHARKNSSFDPFYVNENMSTENFRTFPDIRLHASYHVMGYQYNILAHMLLTIYDGNIPKAGPAHKEAVRKVDEQAKKDVRTLCGISLSNVHTPSAILIAAMAISLCGDRFTDYEEQKELEQILVRTEQLNGWPTAAAQHQLRQAWGWN